MSQEKGFVYLIRKSRTRYYKIGFTRSSPKERLNQLQTGNERELSLVYAVKVYGYRDLENSIQEENFAFKTDQGGEEWYEMSTESAERTARKMREWCRREHFKRARKPLSSLEGSCITDAEQQLAKILSLLADQHLPNPEGVSGAKEIIKRLDKVNLIDDSRKEIITDVLDLNLDD